MKNKYFYTIMEGDKFMASNFMRGLVDNITEAIMLSSEDEALEWFEGLNKSRDFRIVEIECIVREYQ